MMPNFPAVLAEVPLVPGGHFCVKEVCAKRFFAFTEFQLHTRHINRYGRGFETRVEGMRTLAAGATKASE